jgi:hypothetical protein
MAAVQLLLLLLTAKRLQPALALVAAAVLMPGSQQARPLGSLSCWRLTRSTGRGLH